MRSMPMPQPTAGVRLPPSCANNAVVAAAAADRALRAEAIGDPLEHGQVVVVETAHQARVDRGRRARRHRARRGRRRSGRATRRRGSRSAAARRRRSPASPGSCCRGCAADCCAGGAAHPRRAHRRAALEVRDQPGAMRAALVGLAEAVDLEANVARRRPDRGPAAARGTSGSARRRRRARHSRALRRRPGGTGDSGPSAAARGGTSRPM